MQSQSCPAISSERPTRRARAGVLPGRVEGRGRGGRGGVAAACRGFGHYERLLRSPRIVGSNRRRIRVGVLEPSRGVEQEDQPRVAARRQPTLSCVWAACTTTEWCWGNNRWSKGWDAWSRRRSFVWAQARGQAQDWGSGIGVGPRSLEFWPSNSELSDPSAAKCFSVRRQCLSGRKRDLYRPLQGRQGHSPQNEAGGERVSPCAQLYTSYISVVSCIVVTCLVPSPCPPKSGVEWELVERSHEDLQLCRFNVY